LLDALAQAFKVPTHFGRNWDALNDILSDLSWVGGSGFVLLFLNADAFAADNPAVFKAAVEVLQTVAKSWREKRKPFWVLLEGSAEWKAHLPKLMLG
jgi:RNAse (barnase) inhibitor barstar